jgi:hypothetical protein
MGLDGLGWQGYVTNYVTKNFRGRKGFGQENAFCKWVPLSSHEILKIRIVLFDLDSFLLVTEIPPRRVFFEMIEGSLSAQNETVYVR